MAGPSSAADRAQRAGSLITEILDERPPRAPDFAAESNALHRLAEALTAPNRPSQTPSSRLRTAQVVSPSNWPRANCSRFPSATSQV